MRISRHLLGEIVAHARAEAPNECCGMVAARDGQAVAVHRARNIAANPKLAYSVDPQDQFRIEIGIDDAGLELGAIYHSHPRTEPVPSQTDINLALHPHALYLIVGLAGEEPDIRAFRIEDGKVTDAPLEVEDAAPLDT